MTIVYILAAWAVLSLIAGHPIGRALARLNPEPTPEDAAHLEWLRSLRDDAPGGED